LQIREKTTTGGRKYTLGVGEDARKKVGRLGCEVLGIRILKKQGTGMLAGDNNPTGEMNLPGFTPQEKKGQRMILLYDEKTGRTRGGRGVPPGAAGGIRGGGPREGTSFPI